MDRIDDKHAFLLTATGLLSGAIDDLEQTWLEIETLQTGHVYDLYLAYFQLNGATSAQINDAAHQFFDLQANA